MIDEFALDPKGILLGTLGEQPILEKIQRMSFHLMAAGISW